MTSEQELNGAYALGVMAAEELKKMLTENRGVSTGDSLIFMGFADAWQSQLDALDVEFEAKTKAQRLARRRNRK